MAKLYLCLFLALVIVHATARNIPTHQTKPSASDRATNPTTTNAFAPLQNTENVATTTTAAAPGSAVDDQKNFITYGGGGGGGGWGGWGGVLPIFGGIGGIGGASGLGGVGGGAGGVGGVGGIVP